MNSPFVPFWPLPVTLLPLPMAQDPILPHVLMCSNAGFTQPWTAWPWDLLILSPTCGVGWCPRLSSAYSHTHSHLPTPWSCLMLQTGAPMMAQSQWAAAVSSTGHSGSGICCRWFIQMTSSPSQPPMNTTAINAFANTSLQDYSHSRAMCPFVQHVTTFLKIAVLRINEQIFFTKHWKCKGKHDE